VIQALTSDRPDDTFYVSVGESRQMPLMARLRSELSGSPIHSTH
jgi:hypothetical protein